MDSRTSNHSAPLEHDSSAWSLKTGFILSLRATGRTPKTESNYRESLELLERFAGYRGVSGTKSVLKRPSS